MNALLLLRSRRGAIPAVGVALASALALAALHFDLPGALPVVELLSFGALGVAIGRVLVAADKAAPEKTREPVQKSEAVDRLLRSIAKLIQTHLADSEAYSERLHGATDRLSQHPQAGDANEIVLALIEDNRTMRDRLANFRGELEELRLRALQLQNDLERSEEAGMRDPVTMIGNRRNFDLALAEELQKAERTGADFLPRAGRSGSFQTRQ